ncbi:MAG: Asp-tRNA(Asn)/Glu-tRNA(Gln) amidotransferase subunit GatB [Patescibacteria group bacterium]
MPKYYYTIGLEIHAELKTQTKMFCSCKNDPNEKNPNTNICPVCLAHPGTLPVLNKKAIESVIKTGLALGAGIANFTEFDRKNYFYPDIPKGYQISQYKYPIVSGGKLANYGLNATDFRITRVHLEEDTANAKHDRGDYSLIDFNRAGLPLMELVTEPHTFDNPENTIKIASNFAKEFQLILWYLDISEANMEKGQMRVEANMSISLDPKKLGTKVEVKNLNSFRNMERAVQYEFERMLKLFSENKQEEIVQETRGWDDAKQKTFSQRKKESSHDYRYFPDPDLPKLNLSEVFDLEKIKKELPELPAAKRIRYQTTSLTPPYGFGIKSEDIEMYINNLELANYFEEIIKILNGPSLTPQCLEKIKLASNYITSDLMGLKAEVGKSDLSVLGKSDLPTSSSALEFQYPSPENFAELINLAFENKISSRAAKDILAMIVVKDESPLKIATEKKLFQQNDENSLKIIAQKIIDENPQIVADYKNGKQTTGLTPLNILMSLVGKIMKATQGSANPQLAQKVLIEIL